MYHLLLYCLKDVHIEFNEIIFIKYWVALIKKNQFYILMLIMIIKFENL